MAPDRDTEKLILEAARKVFHRDGCNARTQEIADEAGINKALLHYYYRTKDKLFESVFVDDFSALWNMQADLLQGDDDIFTVIRGFVRNYIGFLKDHPYLPQFVHQELTRNPERLHQVIDRKHQLKATFAVLVQQAIADGRIIQIGLEDLITNIMSLSVHPFIARQMIMKAHGFDENQFEDFIEQRKESVAEFIIRAIHA
jgi:AcrR family transcriptional regulator